MNSYMLIDTFESMTHHVMSISMNTPLLVYGLKRAINRSIVILGHFILLSLPFFYTVLSMVNDHFNCF